MAERRGEDLDFGVEPVTAAIEPGEDAGLGEGVGAEENPDDGEGEREVMMGEGEEDDAEGDHAAEAPAHDDGGSARAAHRHFEDDAGCKKGLGDGGDVNEGAGELGELEVVWSHPLDEVGAADEEGEAEAAHGNGGDVPREADGFFREVGALRAEVLSGEGSGGGAEGKAGEKAHRFHAHAHHVRAESSFDADVSDNEDAVGLNRPHEEDFKRLRGGDADDALDGLRVPAQSVALPGEGDGGAFFRENENQKDQTAAPADDRAGGDTANSHAEREGEGDAANGVDDVDAEHREKGRAGVARATERAHDAKHGTADGARKRENGEEISHVLACLGRNFHDIDEGVATKIHD